MVLVIRWPQDLTEANRRRRDLFPALGTLREVRGSSIETKESSTQCMVSIVGGLYVL